MAHQPDPTRNYNLKFKGVGNKGFSLIETCVGLFLVVLTAGVAYKFLYLFDITKVLDAFQKLTFLPPAMMVVAYNLRLKIVELSGKDGLSESEQQRLNKIIHRNVSYIFWLTIYYLVAAVLLGFSPLIDTVTSRPDLLVLAIICILTFAFFSFVCLLLAFGEVERFKFQIEERARESKERERLLNKMK